MKNAYVQFMEEYEKQQHMTPKQRSEEGCEQSYILPYQPVIRPDSTTTKLRVVFDGSAKTTLETSLNDKLIAGP